MIKILLIISSTIFLLSCEEKVVLEGTTIDIISAAGEPFKDGAYLSSPLAHGILTSEDDTINVLVLSKFDNKSEMVVQPLATFQIEEQGKSIPYVLAFPSDDRLLSMPRMSYNDFVIKHNSAKVIIDMYFSNYKGLGKSRVINWQNTHIAKKVLHDFNQKK
jgi:hypothetical protein